MELSAERLYELYWGQNLSAREIAARFSGFRHDSVRLWLVADGIPRRRSNWRKYSSCMVEGCDRPIKQLFNGKVVYGRLCREHLNERDNRRQRIFEAERRELSGQRLASEIARLLVGLPESVKADAESEIMLAALSGVLALPVTRESVKSYIAAAFRENADAYKFLSLQAPASSDEGAQTWGDRLGLS